jgi:hypothetical protein
MTIVIKSLTGCTYYIPFYGKMPAGRFLTQVVAPAMGYLPEKNGDVLHRFVHSRSLVFTRANRGKRVDELLRDGDVIFHTLMLGRFDESVAGNGDRTPATSFQFQLAPDAVAGDNKDLSVSGIIKRESSGGVIKRESSVCKKSKHSI